MNASVILPAYVPEPLLGMTRECLGSLKATADDHELVVIDNGSTRIASQYLARAADHYLRYEDAIGYARAANIGLAAARHDWLCVINTDIQWCSNGWLDQFRIDYEQTKGGVLGAMDDGRQEFIYDESWFSCWFTHRDVIRKVGYFDESLAYRFHDQDYAIRVHQSGHRVMRTPNVPVSHINSATYGLMGRNEDPEERDEMLRRYGTDLYNDWVRMAVALRTWANWHEIHQPYELRYWQDIGLKHLLDEERFQAWWATIFEFIEPTGKRLDVGCGPRPPFGKHSTAIDPLIESYKEITPPEWWAGVKTISSPAEVKQHIGKFDTVMCWNCIDHTIGWKDILKNLRLYAKGKVALATDFHRPAAGHPGFEREEFFSEVEKYFEIEKYADDFQERTVALVLK